MAVILVEGRWIFGVPIGWHCCTPCYHLLPRDHANATIHPGAGIHISNSPTSHSKPKPSKHSGPRSEHGVSGHLPSTIQPTVLPTTSYQGWNITPFLLASYACMGMALSPCGFIHPVVPKETIVVNHKGGAKWQEQCAQVLVV